MRSNLITSCISPRFTWWKERTHSGKLSSDFHVSPVVHKYTQTRTLTHRRKEGERGEGRKKEGGGEGEGRKKEGGRQGRRKEEGRREGCLTDLHARVGHLRTEQAVPGIPELQRKWGKATNILYSVKT